MSPALQQPRNGDIATTTTAPSSDDSDDGLGFVAALQHHHDLRPGSLPMMPALCWLSLAVLVAVAERCVAMYLTGRIKEDETRGYLQIAASLLVFPTLCLTVTRAPCGGPPVAAKILVTRCEAQRKFPRAGRRSLCHVEHGLPLLRLTT